MKKRVLSIFLALVMVLSLMPSMSITASAEEAGAKGYGEVITFNDRKTAFSSHFVLTTGHDCDEGWYAGMDGDPIVIEPISDNIVITAIDAVISKGGEYYNAAGYSSGEKVENGSVENGSTVHVRNIYTSRLEINSYSGEYFALDKITVYYTEISDGEVIVYNESNYTESEHFTVTTRDANIWGWFPGLDDDTVVIEAKTDNIVITAIEAKIGGGGECYYAAEYSSGEKVETGAVDDDSTVHVKNIFSNRLEINCQIGPSFGIDKITVYYTEIGNGEELAYDDSKSALSPHFLLSAGHDCEEGWNVGLDGDPLFIESISDSIVITAIDAVIRSGGEYYTAAEYSSGEKVETGSVENGSTVHVKNIYANHLTINTPSGSDFVIDKVTVYYTHIHDFTGTAKDNGNGTHSFKCTLCDEYSWAFDHAWDDGKITTPATSTSEGVMTYTCSECGATKTAATQKFPYTYYTVDGTTAVRHEDGNCTEYETVTENTATFEDGKWYVVSGDVTFDRRITVNGTANLILCDGAELTASNGIEVSGENVLNIFAQSEDANTMGKLTAAGGEDAAVGRSTIEYAGIGGGNGSAGGTVTIHGGEITAYGGDDSAGIGGGNGGAGGTVTIYGGKITAYGDYGSGGIGAGNNADGGTVTIYGGTVNVTGGAASGAIGGSANRNGGNITINGGTIKAKGGASGAAIGSGWLGNGGNVTINGGTVTAAGSYNTGVGIGGGEDSHNSTVVINGGEVAATGGDAGIGNCTLTLGEGVVFGAGESAEKTTLWGSNANASEAVGQKYFVTPYDVVRYIYYTLDGETAVKHDDGGCHKYESVSAETTAFENGKWYVVSEDVTVSRRITVSGTANLILCDGAALTASKGIQVSDGNTLNIYGQSGGTGELIAKAEKAGSNAAIGGDYMDAGGSINIHGGRITATGSNSGAGIGGSVRNGGSVSIFDGTVEAVGGMYSAGIGGGNQGTDGTISIYGGTINATGGENSAAIGGGRNSRGGTISIHGGTVTAVGGTSSAGIGGGYYGDGDAITITGGTVNAAGGNGGASAIGGNGDTITINGGNVTATAGDGWSYAIYNCTLTLGDDVIFGAGDDADHITVKGGNGNASNALGLHYFVTPYGHEHVFDGKVVDAKYLKSAATCTEAAVYYKSCECGEKGSDTFISGSAKGHNYGEATYTWKGQECTAKVTCSDCTSSTRGHTVTETVAALYTEDTPATCTEPSKGHYRTFFLNELFEDQTTEANSVRHGSPLGHEFSGAWEKVDDAQHKRVCTRCGAETEYENHAWIAATCTTPKTCVRCQATEGEPLGHTLTTATCTEAPYCLTCHEYVGEPLGHLLTAPDCTVPVFCLRCHETISPALGHDWGAWTSLSETQHQRVCKRDETHKETVDHTWDNGKVTKAATHMAEGVMTYTCTKCGATRTETIAKLTAHIFSQEVATAKYLKSAATCTEAAVYYKSCECGVASTTDTFTSGKPLGHKLSKTDAVAATCTAAGNSEYYTCSTCSKYFSDAAGTKAIAKDSWVIKALGHTEVTDGAVEATCTKTGLTEGKHCSVCNAVIVAQKEVAAKGHTYGDPIYNWNGQKCTAARTCNVCEEGTTGHTQTETVTGTYVKDTDATCSTAESGHYQAEFTNKAFTAQQTAKNSVTNGKALGHSFPNTWEQYNAEQHKHTCTRCKTEVAYENHAWNRGRVTKAATHMAEGVMTYTCTKCGAAKTETIAKLTTHTYDREVVDAKYLKSAATCTAAAVYYKSCECGEASTNQTFTYGKALGHSYGEWTSISETQHQHVCANDASHVVAANHNFFGNTCVDCGYTKPVINSLSGKVVSFNNEDDVITIELLKDGEVAYTTTVTGNDTTYAFDAVAAGTYTLKATKSGHAVSQYTVTVNGTVTQDVKIYLLGDVDGNGKVNMVDVTKIRQYLTNNAKYPLDVPAAADVDNSGKINMVDVTKTRQYLTNKDKYPLGK